MTNEELDGLLAVLRKHNVKQYGDGRGIFIHLSPLKDPSAAETSAPAKTEPPLPEPGAVEPLPFDLEDVLHGAK